MRNRREVGGPGRGRPPRCPVRQTKVTGGPDDGRTTSFEYDNSGNTTKRTTGANVQDLKWDAEVHLANLTEVGKTSSCVYDAGCVICRLHSSSRNRATGPGAGFLV
ncbi:hypothetical protein [Streptomyces sp. NPDC001880]